MAFILAEASDLAALCLLAAGECGWDARGSAALELAELADREREPEADCSDDKVELEARAWLVGTLRPEVALLSLNDPRVGKLDEEAASWDRLRRLGVLWAVVGAGMTAMVVRVAVRMQRGKASKVALGEGD